MLTRESTNLTRCVLCIGVDGNESNVFAIIFLRHRFQSRSIQANKWAVDADEGHHDQSALLEIIQTQRFANIVTQGEVRDRLANRSGNLLVCFGRGWIAH